MMIYLPNLVILFDIVFLLLFGSGKGNFWQGKKKRFLFLSVDCFCESVFFV